MDRCNEQVKKPTNHVAATVLSHRHLLLSLSVPYCIEFHKQTFKRVQSCVESVTANVTPI